MISTLPESDSNERGPVVNKILLLAAKESPDAI